MKEFHNKPLWQLTADEFIEILNSKFHPEKVNESKDDNQSQINYDSTEYAYGIQGLAALLGSSKRYAQKLKSDGVFDEAIIQKGRTIIINKQKALELFKKYSDEY